MVFIGATLLALMDIKRVKDYKHRMKFVFLFAEVITY